MEALEERNRQLTDELTQMKHQMARMLEAMEKLQHEDDGSSHAGGNSREHLNALEERLRAVEGHNFDIGNAAELCLVQDIQFPPKFKVPDFPKYTGTSCPKNHLTMYCRKMAAYANNEKLLIHCFQESLSDVALNWYMQLEGGKIQTWKQLADAFLKRYKYNIDLMPDRSTLQNLSKKEEESFKAYAQRWRELAAQVDPPLSDKETVSLFINSLTGPYYDKMIGNTSTLFADIVTIGERVEQGLRSGRITGPSKGQDFKRAFGKKKEGGVNAVTISTASPPARPMPRVEKKFDHIPTSYTDLLPQLLKASMIVRLPPQKEMKPPYPPWYHPNETCDYHSGAPGHSVENCKSLKIRVQGLIDAGWLKFNKDAPNIDDKPLPKYDD